MSPTMRINNGTLRLSSGNLIVPAPPNTLDLTGFDYSADNYLLANPNVTQTDKTIVSLWFKWDTAEVTDTFNFMIHNSGGRFYCDLSELGQIQFQTYNSAVTLINWTVSSTPHPEWMTDDTWHHILYSRSGTTSHLYIDDVDDLLQTIPNTAGNASNDSAIGWYVGMAFNSTFGFKGCLSNMYQNHQEYLDFSIVANRRKFITAGLEPVDPLGDGAGPTGTAPEIWVPNGLPTTNAGSLGNYSLTSGDGAVAC